MLVYGAMVGGVFGYLFNSVVDAVRSRAAERRGIRSRKKRASLENESASKVADFYRRRHRLDELYATQTLGTSRPLALIQDGAMKPGVIDLREDCYVSVGSFEREELEVDKRIVRNRRYGGARLWDGDLAYIERFLPVDGENETLRINAGICGFYSYVTISERVRAVYNGRGCRFTSLVEDQLAYLPESGEVAVKPIALSGATICVFETADGPMTMLHTRSGEVVSSGGFRSVTPAFGLEPNSAGNVRSQFGLLGFNFLKEFLEELYGQIEVVRTDERQHLSPDWMFETALGRALLNEFDTGRAKLHLLGAGIDCADATYSCVILAHFMDQAYFSSFLVSAEGNWEARTAPGGGSFELLNIFDPKLVDLAVHGGMTTVSVFALDLARKFLGPA